MKYILALLSLIIASLSSMAEQDPRTMNVVETTGIFDGKLVEVGNFHRDRVYKINEYLIVGDDLTQEQVEKYKGKKVRIKGLLKIVKDYYHPAKSSRGGRIYEPLREPDKYFIINPQFTIMD